LAAFWKWGGAVLCGAALLVPFPVTVRCTLVAPDSARRGHDVPIVIRLVNTGKAPENLYLTGRTITFDIVVARPDGQVVWRRLEHVTGQQILQVKTLGPGDLMELNDVWRANVDPGDYTVTGIVPTDRQPLQTAPVRVRITP
jgi:Intracellular proteinase inhibitor